MSEITREYLEEKFGRIESRIDDLKLYVDHQNRELKQELKTYVDDGFNHHTKRLEALIEEKIDDLTRMTARGFEDIKQKLDVREQVQDLNRRVGRVEHALNIN